MKKPFARENKGTIGRVFLTLKTGIKGKKRAETGTATFLIPGQNLPKKRSEPRIILVGM